MSPQVCGATVLPLSLFQTSKHYPSAPVQAFPEGLSHPKLTHRTYFTWHSNILIYLLTQNFELPWARPSLHTVCQHLESLPQDKKRDLTL